MESIVWEQCWPPDLRVAHDELEQLRREATDLRVMRGLASDAPLPGLARCAPRFRHADADASAPCQRDLCEGRGGSTASRRSRGKVIRIPS
jgi:hypothetical protein